MKYHRTQIRDTCVPAGHVHCENCDKAIIVPRSYVEGCSNITCYDCQHKSMVTRATIGHEIRK